MIRWILLSILACFSSASYAICATGSMQYGTPLYVDLSDKLSAARPTWTMTYTTQYTGSFNCSTTSSKFGYTRILSTDSTYATILGFNNNTYKVRAEIIDAPAEKTLNGFGGHNAAELNAGITLRFTLVNDPGKAISGDTAYLGDIFFVSDLSGLSVWDVITWPINQVFKILQWLLNGFKWPYDLKDMYGQPLTIRYVPKMSTCSFTNPGLTVKLPMMGLQRVTSGKNQPGLTPFTLNFSCQGLTSNGTSDRSIEMFLSSNNLLPSDASVLVDNNASAAQGIGLRIIKRDTPQSPVILSSSTTVRGSATALFSVAAGGALAGNFTIPMAAYYYAWNPMNATQGTLNTSAMLNIIYP